MNIQRSKKVNKNLTLQEIEEKIKYINSKEKISKHTKGKLLGRGGFPIVTNLPVKATTKSSQLKSIKKKISANQDKNKNY